MTNQTTRIRKKENRPPTARFNNEECSILLKAFRAARDARVLSFEKFDTLNKIENKLLHRIRTDGARKKAEEEASAINLQNSGGQNQSRGNIQQSEGRESVGEDAGNGRSEDPALSIQSSASA